MRTRRKLHIKSYLIFAGRCQPRAASNSIEKLRSLVSVLG